jgi:hypothetical protein
MRRSWTPEPSRPAWIRPTSPTRTQAPHPLPGLIGVIALAGGGVDLTLHARPLGIDRGPSGGMSLKALHRPAVAE